MSVNLLLNPPAELLTHLSAGREETDALFNIVKPAYWYQRPVAERHRIIFYVGHLDTFDWNILRCPLGLESFQPAFDRLFAFGIDPVDGGLPSDQESDWPSLEEVEAYRQQIRSTLDKALAQAPDSEELVQLLHIAIEHRLMHAETLEYLFHQLPHAAKVHPSSSPTFAPVSVDPGQILAIPAGQVTLGLPRSGGQFGWDNEFDAHTLDVPAFSIDKYKITNGQFLEFMEDGGYARHSFWSNADWTWKVAAQILHPVFWVPSKDGFRFRAMFEDVPLPLDAPVLVSHAEACAYARWAGKALPTEGQWQRAAQGAKPPEISRALWDAPPVGWPLARASDFGLEGLYGTAWEWTSSRFAPFSGFCEFAAYPGYSAKFFDGRHFVMKGGSVRTASRLLRPTFRNWFQAHYQYTYAGFRCVDHS